ncbi:DUF2760 domain-containing protein [Aggregicoccus sp. 17bor-14]|uniref:DUF2760 domain-containing protein n=1 Tax=Myxococcaceae TaxID=31 RepID=UPI00129C4BC8|nr:MULTISPECIES: DUF2760 domain-containing protein [Myxococcaceae]MBF5042707.1 DUF2760 domain-containing protein [Simulacricoccus sp. 17bor-14]MRI88475.1 DUF2760 domain-containing protein [Aggregicoccus sp. 17bor-14]
MTEQASLSFFARLWLAFLCFWRVLVSRPFAQAVLPASRAYDEGTLAQLPSGSTLQPKAALPDKAPAPKAPAAPVRPPPEKEHASGLAVLGMLQREGRLIDFLQEDVAAFSDADVGAAARIVHEGCRKVVQQYLALEPVLQESEGARVSVPVGFDAQRIRLTGNVAGQPPFAGSLKHHGWVTTAVRFPELSGALDARVLAPAEVELP